MVYVMTEDDSSTLRVLVPYWNSYSAGTRYRYCTVPGALIKFPPATPHFSTGTNLYEYCGTDCMYSYGTFFDVQ